MVIALILFFGLAQTAQAGFGISPPDVRNDSLGRGSHFEQKITLVRGDPIEDWKAEITINVPGANDWISINKGKEFVLLKGEKQVPIIVSVDVPKDAKFDRYKGTIRVRTSPLTSPVGGTVAIALGGQIDVDLNVTKEVFDFSVRGVKVFDLEEGHKFWFWYIPGKIKFSMKIENIGNVKVAPTRVLIDIYDAQEENLLESVETTKMSSKIKPFETKEIIAELKTKLPSGSYRTKFKIFKGEEIAQGGEGKIHLSILPYGTISKGKISLTDLPNWLKITVGLIILIILIIVGYLIFKKKKTIKISNF